MDKTPRPNLFPDAKITVAELRMFRRRELGLKVYRFTRTRTETFTEAVEVEADSEDMAWSIIECPGSDCAPVDWYEEDSDEWTDSPHLDKIRD